MMTDFSDRIDILKYALEIEKLTSQFLSHLLGIDDHKKSRTLGNKGSALSFNTKIDLLIDIGALDIDTKNKFQSFMEIRNQFMHNSYANSYELCFSFLDKKENFLFSKYPQPLILTKEQRLKAAVKQLCYELLIKVVDIIKVVEAKVKKQMEFEMTAKSHASIFEAFEDILENYEQLYKEMAEQDPMFHKKEERVKVLMLLTDVWKKKFDKKLE